MTTTARPPSTTRAQTAPPATSFGPVSGPVCGLLTAVVMSLAIRNVPIPVWSALPVAALAIAAHWLAVRIRDQKPIVGWYATSCWLVGAGWATATGWLGYSWAAVIGLIAAGVVAIIVAQALAAAPPPPVIPPVIVPPPRKPEDPRAAALRHLLDQTFRLAEPNGFTVNKFTPWPGDTGYSMTATFPRGSRLTLDKVAAEAEALKAELRLPNGGTVVVSGGAHHAEVVFDVTTKNKLGELFPFPMPLRARSIRDGFPIGMTAAGAPLEINLYQSAALFVARRGGGKTVMFHNIVAQLAQCKDTLIWVIDCNGAGAAMPWMRPFATGEVDQPVIDWVASTPEEAELMAGVALAIALDRKSRYAPMLVEQNTDILPVSAKIPAIQILVDEGHEIFGDNASVAAKRVAVMLDRVMKIGRAMCVQIHITSQRGTLSYLPSNLKVACEVRAVGQVDNDNEIGLAMEWSGNLKARSLTTKGQWFVRTNLSTPPVITKTFNMLPHQMGEIAVAVAGWRPELDEPGRIKGKTIYALRGDRMAPWLRRVAGHPDQEDPGAPVDLDALLRAGDPVAAGAATAAGIAEGIRQRTAEVFAAARQGHAVMATTPPDRVELEPDPEPTALGPGHQFVLDMIRQGTPPGVQRADLVAAAIAANLTQRPQTVSDWIAELAQQGLVDKGDRWGTWFAVGHQVAAADGE